MPTAGFDGLTRFVLRVLLIAPLLTACSPATRPADTASTPTVRSDEVAVNGGTIHIESQGAGETVLLIHGGFGDRRMWDAQFGALANDYRVVRMDLRGFGKSPPASAAYASVADVIAVLDRLGVAQAHLVGNSMGGALAIDVALAHPERVASLTSVSSGPNGFPASPEDRARYAADIADIVSVFKAASAQGVERGVALWEAQPMVVVAHADPRTASHLHRMIDENRGLFSLQFWPDDDKSAVNRLEQIRVPTLLIVGDRDIGMVRAAVDYAAQRIPGASKITIAGTDHLPQMEEPAQFNRVLTDFLRAH